jgi:hypothetical protein
MHLLSEIFLKKASPLFHFGTIMSLARIPRHEFELFLDKTLAAVLASPRALLVQAILDFTQCHPYYTQLFAYHLWEHAAHGLPLTTASVIDHVIALHADAYVSLWMLLTLRQRNLLRALACDESAPLSQSHVIAKWDLGSAATVSKVIAHLERDGFIERSPTLRLHCSDPFFKIWVERL